MTYLCANCGVIFSTKFQRMVTFHFKGVGGGSEKNSHYFPFSSDVELYLRSLNILIILGGMVKIYWKGLQGKTKWILEAR